MVSVTLFGMVGYVIIERYPWLDALYMAVITISTVGYHEVHPLDSAGRIFTIIFIVTGVGTSFYLLAVIAELLIEGRLREHLGATAMHRMIQHLRDHVIICGFGRFGRVVAEELKRNSVPLVVIDPDPTCAADLARLAIPYLNASALEDSVLEEAAIGSARALVVATGSDADNVYITLSAREKNPKIRIHARAESDAGNRRLKLAGADQVITVYQQGGFRVATMILRPSVVDFLELVMPGRGDEIDLEEIRVSETSAILGRRIREVEHDFPQLRIVALRRNAALSLIPDSQTVIESNDLLVAIGDRGSLRKLAESTVR
jgi:voltage-gated potassium channel